MMRIWTGGYLYRWFVIGSKDNAVLISTDGSGNMGLYVDSGWVAVMSGSQSKMPVFNDLHLHCFTWKSSGSFKVVQVPGWCGYAFLGWADIVSVYCSGTWTRTFLADRSYTCSRVRALVLYHLELPP